MNRWTVAQIAIGSLTFVLYGCKDGGQTQVEEKIHQEKSKIWKRFVDFQQNFAHNSNFSSFEIISKTFVLGRTGTRAVRPEAGPANGGRTN